MSPVVWQITALSLFGLGMLCLGYKAIRRSPRLRHEVHAGLCPGRRRPWVLCLDPRWWFLVRRGCGYDLTGIAPGESGVVRCPECGTAVETRRVVRTLARWRPAWLGVFLMLGAAGAGLGPPITSGEWVEMVPTRALVAAESARWAQPGPLKEELERRVWRGSVRAHEAEALVRALAPDLADDEVMWNADRALDLIEQLGRDGVPALEPLLDSEDDQQRRLAAHLLRMGEAEPTPEMFTLALSALDSKTGRRYGFWSAREYLRDHAHEALPWIGWGLDDPDQRRAFECASIVADFKVEPLYERAIPVLIRSLADNDLSWDASGAQWDLRRLGRPSVKALEHALASDDWQQRRLATGALWSLVEGGEAGVTERLLVATIDQLRGRPRDATYRWGYSGSAALKLIDHAEQAAPLLAQALRSDSPRQRVLAAGVVGFAGLDSLAPEAIPILIPHLRDNEIPGDAKWALAALARLGPASVPALLEYTDDEDEQLAACAAYLVAVAWGEQPEEPGITDITHRPEDLAPGRINLYWLHHLDGAG